MKMIKKFTALLMVLCLCLSSVSAAGNLTITPRSWDQLLSCELSFDLASDGKISAYGYTSGISDSTEVTVGLYVERQPNNGGGWSSVPGMSWTDSSTTGSVYIVKERWVTSGYSYRLRVEHSATGSYGTETFTSYSSVYKYS